MKTVFFISPANTSSGVLTSKIFSLKLLILPILFVIFSCKDEAIITPKVDQGLYPIFTRTGEVELEDIKPLHDFYCDMVSDSIIYWRNHSTLTDGKIITVWNMIKNQMATTLDLTPTQVGIMLNDMDITSTNFGGLYDLRYSILLTEQADYLSDLDALYELNMEEEPEDILDILITEIESWKTTMDDDEVDYVIEVVKSSYPYWIDNFEPVQDPGGLNFGWGKHARGAGHLAVGDATGALIGCLGGPAGALLGAVGGSLGAAIDMAIFGE